MMLYPAKKYPAAEAEVLIAYTAVLKEGLLHPAVGYSKVKNGSVVQFNSLALKQL